MSSCVLALAGAVHWCPDCPPARAARALVLAQAFWANAAYALLPFLVIGVAVRWIVHRVDRPADRPPDRGVRADD
jgi:hypothetical protein